MGSHRYKRYRRRSTRRSKRKGSKGRHYNNPVTGKFMSKRGYFYLKKLGHRIK